MPAVAPLAAVLIALLAILLIYALSVFGRALAHLLPETIGILGHGIHPRAWVEDGVAALQGAIKWLVGDVIRPVISVFATPALGVVHLVVGLWNLAASAVGEVIWLVDHGVPQLAARLEGLIARSLARAEAFTLRRVAHAVTFLEHRIGDLKATARDWVNAARAAAAAALARAVDRLDGLVHSLRVDAVAWYHAARAYAASLVGALRADMVKAVADAEAIARAGDQAVVSLVKSTEAAAIQAAETYADQAIAAAVGGIAAVDLPSLSALVGGLADDVTSLEGVLGADLPQLGDLLHGLDLTSPLTLTLALTDSLAMSRVLTRYLRDCGVPNCRNLSGMGRFLEDLAGGLSIAALLAMLVAMVEDPEGAARTAADELGGLVQDAVGLAKSTLGVS